MEFLPASRDINTHVGTTPLRVDLPALPPGIKSVRGGAGIHTNFFQDQPAFTKGERGLVLIADLGDWRVRLGSMAPQAFADTDITLASDQVDLTDHGFLTGDGPVRINSDDTLPDALIALAAQGTLTGTANFGNTETVTIDAKVYTFLITLAGGDGEVDIGTDLEESLANLLNAINLGPGSGSAYDAATTIHPTVKAISSDATTLVVGAKVTGGTGGQTIATTDTAANADWGAATLEGGQEVFIVRVDDDTFQVAISRANALADPAVVVDFTDDGTGTHTVTGMQSLGVLVPTASITDGSGGILIRQSQSLVLPAPPVMTLVGFAATDAMSFFFI